MAPHPHIGLQTVTWLLEGEMVHRDSLGSEQLIRPGELNLMTAGNGIAHSEERTDRHEGAFHAVQLWVAQPEETRHGPSDFAHHSDLPRADLGGGVATVLVGDFDGTTSSARRDTDHLGVDLDLHAPSTTLGLRPDFEHALVAFTGSARVDGQVVEPGHLAYLGIGRDELVLETNEPTRMLLIGGVPFDEPVLMWWNFVARTQEEMTDAYDSWMADDGRFSPVDSDLPRIKVEPPPWAAS